MAIQMDLVFKMNKRTREYVYETELKERYKKDALENLDGDNLFFKDFIFFGTSVADWLYENYDPDYSYWENIEKATNEIIEHYLEDPDIGRDFRRYVNDDF